MSKILFGESRRSTVPAQHGLGVESRHRPAGVRYQYLLAILAGAAGGALILAGPFDGSPAFAAMTVLGLAGVTMLLTIGQLRRPCLALLAFVLPLRLDASFMVYPLEHEGGPSAFTVTAGDLILLVLLFDWLAEAAAQSRRSAGGSGSRGAAIGWRTVNTVRLFPKVILPAVLFILLGATSGLFAGDPLLTAYQIFELAKGLVLLLVLANRVQDPQDVRWILAGLMGAVLFQGALGLYQALAGRPMGLTFLGETDWSVRQQLGDRYSIRPVGTFWHTNQLAMYLGMVLPVVASLLLAGSGVGRRAKMAAAAVTVVGLLTAAFTLSRGTWLGLIISAALLSAFGLSKKTVPRAYVLAAPIGLAIMLLMLNLLTGSAVILRLTQSDAGSLQSRVPLMRGALTVFSDFPLLGSGLNNYQYTIKTYDITGQFTETGFLPVVHNLFLLLAAETGFLGLVAFLWLLAALGWRGLRFIRAGDPTLPVVVAAGILVAGQHMIVHNMVHVGIAGDTQLFALFWLLAGLLLALTAWPRFKNSAVPAQFRGAVPAQFRGPVPAQSGGGVPPTSRGASG
jgi:hypothetical protein